MRSMPQRRQAGGEIRAEEHEVDPQAEPFVEIAGAVVPPRELRLGRGAGGGRRRPAPWSRIRCSRPRSGGVTWVSSDERRRVVDVEVGRRDVEIAGDDQRLTPVPGHTVRDGVEERRACAGTRGCPPRGRWARRCWQSGSRRSWPRTSGPRSGPARPGVPAAGRRSSARWRARSATPAQLARRVMDRAVAGVGQLDGREPVGSALGFLQANHVRGVSEPATRARAAAARAAS